LDNCTVSFKSRVALRNANFFNGSPTLGPLALYDILNYQPKRVKLFKTNFFLARNTHTNNYAKRIIAVEEKEYQRHSLHKMIAVHDLASQLNFVRSLWNKSIIEVDGVCESVLKLRTENYMAEMEAIYCSHK
jgi:hypothetical protein